MSEYSEIPSRFKFRYEFLCFSEYHDRAPPQYLTTPSFFPGSEPLQMYQAGNIVKVVDATFLAPLFQWIESSLSTLLEPSYHYILQEHHKTILE